MLRVCGTIHHGGGEKKPERLEKAVEAYLQKAYALEQKVFASPGELRTRPFSLMEQSLLVEIEYFHEKLIKHLDLIERRVLQGETIPHAEKDVSLFEPHTEWINKGKVSPAGELGHTRLITTDQYSLVIDDKGMEQSRGVKETLPLVDRVLARFGDGQIQSWSVDKGGSAQQDRELVERFIPEVIMPKKGRRAQADQVRETQKTFRSLRRQHNAIESDIHALEHHGLNRCPDKGWSGFSGTSGWGSWPTISTKLVPSCWNTTGDASRDSRLRRSIGSRLKEIKHLRETSAKNRRQRDGGGRCARPWSEMWGVGARVRKNLPKHSRKHGVFSQALISL